MANVPFTALPNLNPPGPATIVPVVASGVNYTVTMANLQTYVNSTTGNIQGNYILGNGSQLTGLPATYSDANVVTLMAAFGSNTVSTTGNITGSYILGNGSQLTGLPATYGNANVTTLLAAFGSNTISTTGNITGGNINGIVAVATYATSAGTATVATTANSVAGANVTGTVANATYATSAGTATTATSAGTAATVTTAAQPNITSVGTLTVVNTSGNVSATGNVQGSYILGNGSQLTGIVNSIAAGTGISVSGSTGNVTITNTIGIGKVAYSYATGTYGSNVEILSASVLIPANTFNNNDTIDIWAQWTSNSGLTYPRTARIYVNTANSIPGATTNQVWGAILGATPTCFYRTAVQLDVLNQPNNTRGFAYAGSNSTLSYYNATGFGTNGVSPSPTVYVIDWGVNQYIIFTCQNSGTGTSDGLTNVGYQIYKR